LARDIDAPSHPNSSEDHSAALWAVISNPLKDCDVGG
jgi:hypothetical protein